MQIDSFTKVEMLAYVKRRLGLIAISGVSVESDMTESDKRLMDEFDVFYEKLLQRAPLEYLPVEDVSERVLARYIDDDTAEIFFPTNGVRCVSLLMEGWEHGVTKFLSPECDVARLMKVKGIKGCIDNPVVTVMNGVITVHGVKNPDISDDIMGLSPKIEKLEMVCRPTDGIYKVSKILLDESMPNIKC